MTSNINWSNTAKFAAASGCLSAAWGYMLNYTKVTQLSNPLLQGGIYGVVAAVAMSIALKVMEEDTRPKESVGRNIMDGIALAAPAALGTAVSCAVGLPMSFLGGVALYPAVFAANLAVNGE